MTLCTVYSSSKQVLIEKLDRHKTGGSMGLVYLSITCIIVGFLRGGVQWEGLFLGNPKDS